MLPEDYRDMLSELSKHRVEHLVVGAYAVAAHGLPRYTKDIDIWVRPGMDNARRLWNALAAFGPPMDQHTIEDLANENLIHQIGTEPLRVDILKRLADLDFDRCLERRYEAELDEVRIAFLGYEDLVESKRKAGRGQDLVDIDRLEQQKRNLRDDAD
jgi:predicted nucleotidyltransferase